VVGEFGDVIVGVSGPLIRDQVPVPLSAVFPPMVKVVSSQRS